MGYPGLIAECQEHVITLKLPDLRNSKLSKLQWKSRVKQCTIEKNKRELLSRMAVYKKIDCNRLKDEEFEMKPYLKNSKLADARILFQSRCKMLSTVKMNFKNHPKYIQDAWICSGCTLMDSQEHLLWCSGYSQLRVGLDLGSDEDLAHYYRSIIRMRDAKD